MFKLFANGQVLQPDMSFRHCDILVQDDSFYDLLEPGETARKPVESEVDLEGQLVFPGLINAHDHLIDSCWTGLGKTPVENWFEWNQSIHESNVYRQMQKLSVTDLYVIGMYKNIISGATTVVDHFPAEVSATFAGHPLVSLLEHLYLAHSVSSHQLKWGANPGEQFKQARGILPFMIHAGEGIHQEIREEIEQLNRMGALEKNTILVNCTFLEDADLQLIAARGAAIVWLPSSSERIFGRQPDIKRILELNIPLTLGTDSSITGSTTLLAELKNAWQYSQEHLQGAITARDLVRMATNDAARVFGLEKQAGTITPGRRADFIVFKPESDSDDFEHFINMTPENFSMVVHKGMMMIGNDEFRRISSIDFSQYSEVKLNGTAKILYGQPAQLLERMRHKLGSEIVFPFFNIASED
ncbi:MAG: amidohydrolase family protein [Candidatus Riflebacteria bacterium]|nr:amidohydrolase family protein [Candidatus Riflebacteria bacterium]